MDSKTLGAIINTLNQIPVHGKDYLTKMLGCINLLEKEFIRLQEVENGQNHPAE